jgi:hypothetical protein
MDLFVVPTLSFRLLYGLLILKHGRRQMLWLGVTAHPTAEWIARQLTQACGWESVPRYIIRDRDSVYGEIFKRRLRAMGIRDRPTAPQSPWQNGHTERLIGSIRRECLDHVVVFGERHLRHLLLSYMAYYNSARTHLSLNKDAPLPRAVRARTHSSDSNSRRITPSLCSDLISDKDTQTKNAEGQERRRVQTWLLECAVQVPLRRDRSAGGLPCWKRWATMFTQSKRPRMLL